MKIIPTPIRFGTCYQLSFRVVLPIEAIVGTSSSLVGFKIHSGRLTFAITSLLAGFIVVPGPLKKGALVLEGFIILPISRRKLPKGIVISPVALVYGSYQAGAIISPISIVYGIKPGGIKLIPVRQTFGIAKGLGRFVIQPVGIFAKAISFNKFDIQPINIRFGIIQRFILFLKPLLVKTGFLKPRDGLIIKPLVLLYSDAPIFSVFRIPFGERIASAFQIPFNSLLIQRFEIPIIAKIATIFKVPFVCSVVSVYREFFESLKFLSTLFKIPFAVQRDSHIVSRFVSHFSTSITVARQLGLGSEKTLVTRFEIPFVVQRDS
ncbi:MAG: hypothetical protein B6247_04060, partial [Candidatus Parabeggiatoa sp. nov. 2]